jgi:outer membrane murein-binding lipoprotein Lpp
MNDKNKNARYVTGGSTMPRSTKMMTILLVVWTAFVVVGFLSMTGCSSEERMDMAAAKSQSRKADQEAAAARQEPAAPKMDLTVAEQKGAVARTSNAVGTKPGHTTAPVGVEGKGTPVTTEPMGPEQQGPKGVVADNGKTNNAESIVTVNRKGTHLAAKPQADQSDPGLVEPSLGEDVQTNSALYALPAGQELPETGAIQSCTYEQESAKVGSLGRVKDEAMSKKAAPEEMDTAQFFAAVSQDRPQFPTTIGESISLAKQCYNSGRARWALLASFAGEQWHDVMPGNLNKAATNFYNALSYT